MIMIRILRIILTWISFSVILAACGMTSTQSGIRTQGELKPSVTAAPMYTTTPVGIPACSDPLSVIRAFYDSNDSGNFAVSLEYLSPQPSLTSWAEGVNGRHWHEVHLTGQEQIRPELAKRGLRRDSGVPGAPIYYETEFKLSGDQVTFMLRPDRLSPDGKPFDSYRVIMLFTGCKIQSITLIEYFTQV